MTELDEVIERIATLQSTGDTYFEEGLFPALRTNRLLGYQRPDTTVFFTAIITFTLQKIRHLVSSKSQEIIDNIAEKAVRNYQNFQNKDGLKTYNFWKTKPSKHFPNGKIFIKTKLHPGEKNLFDHWFYKRDSTHIQFFNSKSLKELGRKIEMNGPQIRSEDLTLFTAS